MKHTGRMRRAADPALVTSAPLSLEQERTIREHRYMWTMALRTVMFVIAITAPMPVAARIFLLAASIIVPWLAVMAANQPHHRVQGRAVVGYVPPAPVVSEPLQIDAARVIEGDVS